MKTNHLPRFLQQRKFFLALPLLTIPFITLIFWLLGGGQVNQMQAQSPTAHKGFNLELPTAYLPEEQPLNKLSYYEKATQDSARLEKLLKKDPNCQPPLKPTGEENDLAGIEQKLHLTSNSLNTTLLNPADDVTTQEAQIYQKLQQVNTALKKAEKQPNIKSQIGTGLLNHPGTFLNQADMDRLEQMMGMMKNGNPDEDPEMKQISGMLDKILAIQHPERVRDKVLLTQPHYPRQVLSAGVLPAEPISLVENIPDVRNLGIASAKASLTTKGFLSLEEPKNSLNAEQNTIPAVLHETQTLVEGAVVKLRLMEVIYLNGVTVPAGTLVYGTASLQDERLHIKINHITYQQSLIPVDLTVWDLDGMNGIHMPGTLSREVARQSTNQALQGIGLPTYDPSFGTQAAGAGIEAAKTLLSKKTKQVKVTVKAGYQVLLRDGRQKNFTSPTRT
ncbi:conjugative transposon protein TraM [Adhaeribacter rhizoryzae]|uniref:Conjugative transposon protein TraM n=1 Tax=Adhaeribacter rhizoryzae TaxID=2607907 RepID=A0A5M6DPG0_9BACT|nr:conjugative transposon protein TraM [Adhaeribacter rhizoryzae]KAA5548122.1 conjugative transposon protein TraM [Adhaeribacter rhizoryzae]